MSFAFFTEKKLLRINDQRHILKVSSIVSGTLDEITIILTATFEYHFIFKIMGIIVLKLSIMIKNNLLLDFTSSLGSLLVLLTIVTLLTVAKTFNSFIFAFYFESNTCLTF